jgi:hypothetical protein
MFCTSFKTIPFSPLKPQQLHYPDKDKVVEELFPFSFAHIVTTFAGF